MSSKRNGNTVMMAISTKGRYSVRILMLMASRPEGHMFTMSDIAEAEGISSAYVQQLMATLRAAGFVNSHRGRVGGFTLSRDPIETTVADVLRVSEGQIVMAPCLGTEKCEREAGCATRVLWMRAGELLDELFGGITIAQLVGTDPNELLRCHEES
jgi:Rrf2 family protein